MLRRISGRDVVDAALAGDPLAAEILRAAGRRLGQAFVQLIRILDPDRIAVGGSVSSAGDLLLEPAREIVASCSPRRFRRTPEIVLAHFGRDASVVGGALLGWEAADQARATEDTQACREVQPLGMSGGNPWPVS